MKVVEIFPSIDGEGKRAGLPVTFIRLYGCNLHCTYCDSQYACTEENYLEATVEEIMENVRELGLRAITLTGGEPLIQPGVTSLLQALVAEDFDVNIETNGSVDLSTFAETFGHHIWFTMDYKCGCSGMTDQMNLANFDCLGDMDVLKFVVGSESDLDQVKHVVESHADLAAQIFISPVYGFDPQTIVKYMLDDKLDTCRVQLQLHKYIWDKDKRGV